MLASCCSPPASQLDVVWPRFVFLSGCAPWDDGRVLGCCAEPHDEEGCEQTCGGGSPQGGVLRRRREGALGVRVDFVAQRSAARGPEDAARVGEEAPEGR